MALYAISDLHLSTTVDKPMGVFGEKWILHEEKIRENWLNKVTENDTVIISGDISWGMKISEGMADIEWISKLPGRKILVRGNHDYWWGSIKKLNSLYDNMDFIQNNFFVYEDYAICGSRAWVCPGSSNFGEKDSKIYNRELIRLRLSLEEAKKKEYDKIIVAIHYPPTNDKFEDSGFIDLFKEYGVEKVIYGHLHGPSLKRVFEGEHDGIEYILTSADYIDFNPQLILE